MTTTDNSDQSDADSGLLHFSFAKNKSYFTYPLAHAQKVNRFFTFSETKPKNTFRVTVFFCAVPAGLNRMFH